MKNTIFKIPILFACSILMTNLLLAVFEGIPSEKERKDIHRQAIERRERWEKNERERVLKIVFCGNDFKAGKLFRIKRDEYFTANNQPFVSVTYPQVEWQGQVFDGVQYGLHPSGMVVWRRVK